jgi:hypothetical protein
VSAGELVRLPLPFLDEDEARAADELRRIEQDTPGVKVLWPHHSDEPYRAVLAAGTVPGDGPNTTHTPWGRFPSELLAELTELFGPSG